MVRHFTLEYWMDEGWYVGRLKEVPGVFSQGESLEELKENIRDAYHLMVEEEIPPQITAETKEIGIEVTNMEGIVNEVNNFKRWKEIPNMLIRQGEQLLAQPYRKIEFTGNSKADDLLNDLKNYPHAFVLACIMDRQIKAE